MSLSRNVTVQLDKYNEQGFVKYKSLNNKHSENSLKKTVELNPLKFFKRVFPNPI